MTMVLTISEADSKVVWTLSVTTGGTAHDTGISWSKILITWVIPLSLNYTQNDWWNGIGIEWE